VSGKLSRKFSSEELLSDGESMTWSEDDQDELIQSYTPTDIGKSCEIADKLSSSANLLSMHLDKLLSNALIA
jgi:hypothetical protein